MIFAADVWLDGFLCGAATVAGVALMVAGFVLAFRIEESRQALPALLIFLAGAGLIFLMLRRIE